MNESTPSHPLTKCERCNGRGYHVNVTTAGYIVATPCVCMGGKAEAQRLRRSGLGGIYDRYTLDSWEARRPWQAEAKRKAEGYIGNPRGWFVITGRSGSGKTHLCTAICGKLIERGYEVRYMAWRTEAPKLKGSVNTDVREYERQLDLWKRARILYIDDFWKSRAVSDGDVNLAFDLLSHRDMAGLPTILSTELSIERICEIDEAIGSRIAAQSRALCIKTPNDNYRLGGTA